MNGCCKLLVVLICNSWIGTARACDAGWTEIEGKCFYISDSDTALTWTEAVAYCSAEGGRLFEPQSKDAAAKIDESTDNYWIGIQTGSPSLTFASSGHTIREGNWAGGEPNNFNGNEHCASISNGYWYDELCELDKRFVCEDLNATITFWNACPTGWDLIDGTCYYKSSAAMNFTNAQAYCQAINGTLFEPQYGKQEAGIVNFYNTSMGMWIGISDENAENEYRYLTSRRVVEYSNWLEISEPDSSGDCVVSMGASGWYDKNCTSENQFVCQEDFNPYECPTGYSLYQGRCFYKTDRRKFYLNSVFTCKNSGARMFEPKNELALYLVTQNFFPKGYEDYWIGVRNKRGTTTFNYESDNQEVVYTHWASGQPTQDNSANCVGIGRDGTWTDVDCGTRNLFLCEYLPDFYQPLWDGPSVQQGFNSMKSYAYEKFVATLTEDAAEEIPFFRRYLSIGGVDNGSSTNSTYLIDLYKGDSCSKTDLPESFESPQAHIFSNKILVCQSFGVMFTCYLWSSTNEEWEQLSTPDEMKPYTYSVAVTGGIFFTGSEGSLLLDEATGAWIPSNTTVSLVNGCIVNVDGQVTLIGGNSTNTVSYLDWEMGTTEIVASLSSGTVQSCALVPKSSSVFISILQDDGTSVLELWTSGTNTVEAVSQPDNTELNNPSLLTLDETTVFVSNGKNGTSGAYLENFLMYNTNGGSWLVEEDVPSDLANLVDNAILPLWDETIQGFDSLMRC